MTRRRLFLSHIRRVTISALAGFLELFEFSFDRDCFRISGLLTFAMTRRTCVDRHVGCQATRGARAGNVDVTGRALGDMLAFAAFMSELCGNTLPPKLGDEGCCWFVTTYAV